MSTGKVKKSGTDKSGASVFDRMIEALNLCPDGSPKEIMDCVKGEIDRFVGEAPQFDDLTMLCLEYR